MVFEDSDFAEKFINLHIFHMTPIKIFKKSQLCVNRKNVIC